MSWCNISSDDGDRPQAAKVTIRAARIKRFCCECQSDIAPGEQYEVATLFWGGYVEDFGTCLKCADIRKHFCPDGWDYCGLDAALTGTINRSLEDIRRWWRMPGPERTIQGLVDLVCELLEGEPVEDRLWTQEDLNRADARARELEGLFE